MRKIKQRNDAVSPKVIAERMFGKTDGKNIEQFHNAYAEASQARVPCKALKPADATGFVTAAEIAAIGASDTDTKQELSLAVEHDLSNISAVKPRKQKSYSDKNPFERQVNGKCARLMTVKEVATYLSVSISKVWRLGKYDIDFPKPVHISGSTRWDRHAIDNYLDRLHNTAHSGK
ncbi:hypothetical protein [Brucella sp. NBRC 12950]|uniref:helix-turn-helix transcriptional regulator n=1 Tax=Brucella sp. NBRC 12950 TaxID=2994518 RepID=UPI0024A2C61C|nr:hypothetical protein [Brucella sp. NBRC 12950]GLU29629.1 hypothetical protein Brsp01_48620 [Brucella sp. NBRC 12950]